MGWGKRNNDGDSAPTRDRDTIPTKERNRLQQLAKNYGCDTVDELISSPTTFGKGGGRNGFDSKRGREN